VFPHNATTYAHKHTTNKAAWLRRERRMYLIDFYNN
jgi:hypothetical protein